MSATKQISPGEISKGMFLTVIQNMAIESQFPSVFGGDTQTVVNADRSGMGDVLQVLAVELPYIVVRCEDKYESARFVFKMDTRRTALMELAKDYVEALAPHLKAQ